jgi:hypothetical protein
MSNFIKIFPVGTELIHVYGRKETGMKKLLDAFRNFANTRKKKTGGITSRLTVVDWEVGINDPFRQSHYFTDSFLSVRKYEANCYRVV